MLLPYEITKHKRPNRKTRIVIIAALVILGIALGYQAVKGFDKDVAPSPVHGSLPDGCTHTATGLYCNLTDEVTKQKAQGVTWYEKRTITVKTTAYSRRDSCHNKRELKQDIVKDTNLGKIHKRSTRILCLTAIGKDTTEDRTVACPRNIKLGTPLEYHGKWHICEDRTAEWVQKRNGPTFDIFMEDHAKAKRWGIKTESISIYMKM